MQTLFEVKSRASLDPTVVLTRNIADVGRETIDPDFAYQLLAGIMSHEKDIVDAISKDAPEWPLERMDPITLCILTIGAYELLYEKAIPPAVIMNEAIDTAKEFGSAESGKFVNGVLNALAKKSRS